MKRSILKEWKNLIVENGSYKLVALFVTLILWVTILGQRDFSSSKDMDVEFLLPRGTTVLETSNVVRQVKVRVSGSRMALKKFAQSAASITVDLTRSQSGPVKALITPRNIEVPLGVKVVSVFPESITVNLVPSKGDDERH
jgi:YbbR domain-containing protein